MLAVRTAELAIHPTSTRQEVDSQIEKRRAWDREYRRKQRESTRHPPDIHPTSDDSALSLGEEKNSLSIKKERKKERGTKLPPDWKPKEKHYDEAASRGRDAAWVDEKAKDMRIWCASNSNRAVTTKSDWDATFLAWIRKEPHGNTVSHGGANPAAGRATAREAQHIATMGSAALRYLQEGKSAGNGRVSQDGSGSSGERDADKGAKGAY